MGNNIHIMSVSFYKVLPDQYLLHPEAPPDESHIEGILLVSIYPETLTG